MKKYISTNAQNNCIGTNTKLAILRIENTLVPMYNVVTNKTTEQTAKGENEVAKAYQRHQRNTE